MPEEKEAVPEKDDEELESEKLPFANAQVVRAMRKGLSPDKMIKSEVKKAMNLFLEKICIDIAKRMDKFPYAMIDKYMFDAAIEPYEKIYKVQEEKKRIIKHLEAIKADCDRLIRDVNETFGEKE
ncbi:MAG: hypothetical protein J7K68_00085 [Candidatus Diapherotrites archaeon]|nr:hypothetical protein [Candidatus Diapherotrites archaeon]